MLTRREAVDAQSLANLRRALAALRIKQDPKGRRPLAAWRCHPQAGARTSNERAPTVQTPRLPALWR
jgi:hypothetical protein